MTPFALAMVVCDRLHRDPVSNKFTILGTFSSWTSGRYPVRAQFGTYIALTDGRGKSNLTIRLQTADEEDTLFEADLEADFSADPRIVLEIGIEVGLEVPASGEYRLRLFAGDEHVMERRIVALEAPTE